jgi:hypothetical protein
VLSLHHSDHSGASIGASTGPIAAILEHGSDDQRRALCGFARVRLDATAATAAPAEQLSMVGARPRPNPPAPLDRRRVAHVVVALDHAGVAVNRVACCPPC